MADFFFFEVDIFISLRTSCGRCSLHLCPSAPPRPIVTFLPSDLVSSLFESKNPWTPLCAAHVWGRGHLRGCSTCQDPPTAPSPESVTCPQRSSRTLLTSCWGVAWLGFVHVLCRHEFMGEVVLSCPEDTALLWSSCLQFLNLHALSSKMAPEPWGRVCDAPFVAERTPATCSLQFDQL